MKSEIVGCQSLNNSSASKEKCLFCDEYFQIVEQVIEHIGKVHSDKKKESLAFADGYLERGKEVSREEKPDWPKGLNETLEGEHLDTLVRIRQDLEHILKTTCHRNRDYASLKELLKHLNMIISWSEPKGEKE